MNKVPEIKTDLQHPYLDGLQKNLSVHKKMLEQLILRTTLQPDLKNDFEKNEHEILLTETIGKIKAKKQMVAEMENYYISYAKEFVSDLDECTRNFDIIVEKAKRLSADHPNIRDIMGKINWEGLKVNAEAKIHVYKRLKKMI